MLYRYTSEEFTSIFNEKSQPYSSANYSEVVMEEQVVEEVVTVESEIIMDVSSTGISNTNMSTMIKVYRKAHLFKLCPCNWRSTTNFDV